MRITNFGGNIEFEPKHWYAPTTEEDVLEILNKHAKNNIRVVASGHSWSDVAETSDVAFDMRHFNRVDIETGQNGQAWATVGAGCVLQNLLDTLHQKSEYTLPTIGGIKKQTVSGVVSTATHGSGHPSISHYVQEIRLAAYDPIAGKAKVYEYRDGEELRAARCALGCMGIILSVKLPLVPKYYVTQSVESRDSLDQILAEKDRHKLQQFILMPYCWRYFAWTRHVAQGPPKGISRLRARWTRIYNFISTDIFLHIGLKLLLAISSSRKGSSRLIQSFFSTFLPPLIPRGEVTDFSEHAITLHHDLFRHLEMELFVPERNMKQGMEMIRHITAVFAGAENNASLEIQETLQRIGKYDTLMAHKGFYTHHYPIYCRQIKPDDTLISMTADAQEWHFSVSFFTYLTPDKRDCFYEFSEFIAQVMAQLYEAKPHWGKYFPLVHEDIASLYPNLERFRQLCHQVDPSGVFQNEYARRVLGFRV